MLARIARTVAAIGLAAALASPFASDIYHRYQVWRQIDWVGDANQRAAFADWKGSAQGFQQALRERCLRVYGAASPACARYRAAAN